MDGAKVTFSSRGMTEVAARKIRKSGEPWSTCIWMSFTLPFLLLLFHVFFSFGPPPPVLWWLSPGEDDAVGINCKMGATTANQGAGVKYSCYGVYVR